jgi:predicted adenylyl cyclase CyaB
MPKEIETKFKITSERTQRARLRKIGALRISRRIERDVYFKNRTIHPRGLVVRLRSDGKTVVFTVKTPSGEKATRFFKIRNEHEVIVSERKTFIRMLHLLGFTPLFRKEKVREKFTWQGAKISIDKLPYIGLYIEIEATKEMIKKVARLLGLTIEKGINDTYMGIFRRYKQVHNTPRLELVFKR